MKKSQRELNQDLIEASQRVKIGTIYAHYKDPSHTYKVMDLAVNADDSMVWVIYKALYEEELLFLRSVDEWCDDVEKDGATMKRFIPVETQSE